MANLFRDPRQEDRPYNQIPRDCGRFLWMQAARDRQLGATMLYAAMFDEVDEARRSSNSPRVGIRANQRPFRSTRRCRLPSDWYLRVSKEISEMLKGKAAPSSKLPISPP